MEAQNFCLVTPQGFALVASMRYQEFAIDWARVQVKVLAHCIGNMNMSNIDLMAKSIVACLAGGLVDEELMREVHYIDWPMLGYWAVSL